MANPLTAVARGAANTVGAGARRAAENVAATIPNPAKMAYNIGLGIGPLIQNIVKEMKDKDKKSGDNVVKKLEETKKSQEKGQGKVSTEMGKMTAQLSMSNALLKEIRNLQIKQLASAQKQAGGIGGTTNRMIRQSDARVEAASVASIAAPKGTNSDDSGASGIKTLLGLGLGAVALTEVWKMLPDDMKNDVKKGASSMVSGAADMWLSALKESPALTLLGTYMLTKMTGLFDLAFGTAKAGIAAGKVIGRTPEMVNDLANKIQPAGAAPGVGNALRRYAGMEERLGGKTVTELAKEYKELAKYTDKVYASEVFTGKYGEKGLEAIKAATTDIEAVSGLAKASGVLKTVSRVAAPLAIAGDVGYGAYDYYNAGQEEKKGNISAEEAAKRRGGAVGRTGGSLAGGAAGAWSGSNIGAGVGAVIGGGIGLMFGGIGAVPGAAYGAMAGRFLGGGIGGYYGATAGGDAGRYVGEGVATTFSDQPTVAGTGTSAKSPLIGGDFDYEKYIKLAGQNESGNNYGNDNRVGFLGRYQFGSSALETLGILKSGSTAAFGDKGAGAAVYHPEAWNNGLSRDAFLSNSQLQDELMSKFTEANARALRKSGVITDGMKGEDIASRLYAAHHGGAGGANKFFREGRDTADFANPNSTVATSANKMLAQYSGNAAATTPYTQVASGPNSNITASSLSSQSAMMASSLADAQTSWNAMSKAMFGSEIKIDMSKEINNILGSGAGQTPMAGLMTNNANNPLNKMIFDALGVRT